MCLERNRRAEDKGRSAVELEKNVPLAPLCRLHVGGPADFLARPGGVEELVRALEWARERDLPFFLLGGGSNLFFHDQGFRGLVIRLSSSGVEVDREGLRVRAEAGVRLSSLVLRLARLGLGGLEFLANIPGTVGGAVAGNAGCYGKSVAGLLEGVRLLDARTLQVLDVSPSFLGFRYRHSLLSESPRWILLEAVFRLVPREKEEVLREVRADLRLRLSKHPHREKCAGSFFKNPPGMPAWMAITRAGLAGARVGDAALSPKHANFLVNLGKARSSDILELVRRIRSKVRERLGILLEPEVRYVGPRGIEEMGGMGEEYTFLPRPSPGG